MKLKTEVTDFGPLKQKIVLKNITMNDLTERRGYYSLVVKKRNKRQRLVVRITIIKELIERGKDTKIDICTIHFEKNAFTISLERLYAVKKIRQANDNYIISYTSPSSNKLQYEISNYIEADYYTSRLLPQIMNVKKNKKKQGMTTQAKKNKTYKAELYKDAFKKGNNPIMLSPKPRNFLQKNIGGLTFITLIGMRIITLLIVMGIVRNVKFLEEVAQICIVEEVGNKRTR